jgi:exodeoxyribonuclease VII large subunit
MKPLSVASLNNQIKALLESTFERVQVVGEVSRVTYHSSGHVYFSLKDRHSTISCVMFRGNVSRLKFRIEQGCELVADAAVTVYTPRGDYQLNIFSLSPVGEGALQLAYDQLKNELLNRGYFEAERKKTLPQFPKHIALITSATGAALQDMLRVANKRWKLTKITCIDTIVQGVNAAQQIASNIVHADKLGYFDVIVIGRGGGSMEDLWAFNERVVAEAIYSANTPIVSAVGHEIDTVISDYVADLRAPTPSAALEMILPDSVEMMQYVDSISTQLQGHFKHQYRRKEEQVHHLFKMLRANSMSSKLGFKLQNSELMKARMRSLMQEHLRIKRLQLAPLSTNLLQKKESLVRAKQFKIEVLLEKLKALNPDNKVLKNSAQIIKEGKSVSLDTLEKSELFELQNLETKITAVVKKVERV